jgi:pimeloyl-ACP methyl ester carboxylesterase
MASCAPQGTGQVNALMAQFQGFKDSYDDMNLGPEDLGRIQARTLIVHGDRDEFFPVEVPVRMYRDIPKSTLWIVPQGGHVPIHEERQAEFLRIIYGHIGAKSD